MRRANSVSAGNPGADVRNGSPSQQNVTRKTHSLSLSLKNLFVKAPKTEENKDNIHKVEEQQQQQQQQQRADPGGLKVARQRSTARATSPVSATSRSPVSRDRSISPTARVSKNPNVTPGLDPKSDSTVVDDLGFTAVRVPNMIPLAVPEPAFTPVKSTLSATSVTSRKGSQDQTLSRRASVRSSSRQSSIVQISDDGTTKIYEDGSHEHVLKPIKILEKIPQGSGILSGFLRRSTANGDDTAFSVLPEQNRMDFQRRLSIQSRKTFDEEDEDRSSSFGDGEEDDSEETEDDDYEDDEFKEQAAIGDDQLNLINKLVEKIKTDDVDSSSTNATKSYKLTEKYGKPQGIIGKGTYGIVKLVSKVDTASKREMFYAVKELRKRDNEDVQHFATRLTSEFVISNSLQHLNIVRTFDLMKNSSGIYSEIMEYCAGGDLYNLISKTNREGLLSLEADCFMKQVTNGLDYMHARGVAHCDIKPENILLTTQGVAKISDFGTSAVFRTAWEKECHFSQGACGSEPYVAPEEFICNEYDPRAADVWALGVLYLTMATGTYLWPVAKLSEPLYEDYIETRPQQGKPGTFVPIESMKSGAYYKSRKATVYGMLDPNPSTRLTIEQVMKSSWLQQVRLCDAARDFS